MLHKIEERKAHSLEEDDKKVEDAHTGGSRDPSKRNLEDSAQLQRKPQHQQTQPQDHQQRQQTQQQYGQQQQLRSGSPFNSQNFDTNPPGMSHLDTNLSTIDILNTNLSYASELPLMKGNRGMQQQAPARS